MIMSLFAMQLVFVLVCFLSVGVVVMACPDGILVRKEYRDMTKEEWETFKSTFLALQSDPSPDGKQYSELDYWANLHATHGPKFHGTRLFLPWHRTLLSVLEKRMQRKNSKITLPYWNWAYDWQVPINSPIFTPAYGMEVQINGTDGDCRYPRHFQTPHCLARKYNATNFPAFPNEDYVNLLVTNVKDYASFANQVENNAHNKIHHAFGGDMMTWWSPNDHIFWLFHSFIDKIWSDWNAGAQVPQYNSTELRTILQPFGINFEDVIKSEALCYRFQPYSKSKPYGYKMV